MAAKRELVLATRNPEKKREMKRLLKQAGLNCRIYSLTDFPNAPVIKEDGKSFRENAVKKAVITARSTKKLTLADDSGLEVEALGGRPGVYSSRFAGKNSSDEKNINKLLALLKGTPAHLRKGCFTAFLALADEKGLVGTVDGKCKGRIALERRGKTGFGYDPVFIIPKYGKTFAELGPGVKDRISHRTRAVRKMCKLIKGYFREQTYLLE
jgi:XTP/dITP diphosphohydrolase